jgi:NAD(P)-dependent dehydrogenase (short-subunit alcohol dehydrogenase family)
MGVNTNGVLYTAQAAGRQMVRFGNRGSIILIASMSGTITNKVRNRSMSQVGSSHVVVGWNAYVSYPDDGKIFYKN